jgi:hypothetical protein
MVETSSTRAEFFSGGGLTWEIEVPLCRGAVMDVKAERR